MFCGEPALLPPVGRITSGLRSVIQKAKCNLVLLSSLTHYYLGLFISSLRLLLVRLTKIWAQNIGRDIRQHLCSFNTCTAIHPLHYHYTVIIIYCNLEGTSDEPNNVF